MAAPKYRGSSMNKNAIKKVQTTQHKTITKRLVLNFNPQVEIDRLIASMEAQGYEYYDHISYSTNDMILIFRLCI